MIINGSYSKDINVITGVSNSNSSRKLSNDAASFIKNDLKPDQDLVSRLATNEILLLAQNDDANSSTDALSENIEPGLEPVGYPPIVHTLKDTSDVIQHVYDDGLSSDVLIEAATSIIPSPIKGSKINTHDISETIKRKVKDLEPLHSKEVVGERPDLKKLSDEELINSVSNPMNNDPIKVNTKTGKVVDGNSRTYELQNRAADPNSTITPDTEVPVQNYTPNDSSFWDM